MRKTIIKLLGGFTQDELNNSAQYVANQMNEEFAKVLQQQELLYTPPQVKGFLSHVDDNKYNL